MVLCYALRLKDFLTYALFFFCTVFFVSLQRTNSKSYGKEPIKQVRLAGGNHL